LNDYLGEGVFSEGFVAKRIASNPATTCALLMAYNTRSWLLKLYCLKVN